MLKLFLKVIRSLRQYSFRASKDSNPSPNKKTNLSKTSIFIHALFIVIAIVYSKIILFFYRFSANVLASLGYLSLAVEFIKRKLAVYVFLAIHFRTLFFGSSFQPIIKNLRRGLAWVQAYSIYRLELFAPLMVALFVILVVAGYPLLLLLTAVIPVISLSIIYNYFSTVVTWFRGVIAWRTWNHLYDADTWKLKSLLDQESRRDRSIKRAAQVIDDMTAYEHGHRDSMEASNYVKKRIRIWALAILLVFSILIIRLPGWSWFIKVISDNYMSLSLRFVGCYIHPKIPIILKPFIMVTDFIVIIVDVCLLLIVEADFWRPLSRLSDSSSVESIVRYLQAPVVSLFTPIVFSILMIVVLPFLCFLYYWITGYDTIKYFLNKNNRYFGSAKASKGRDLTFDRYSTLIFRF